MLHGWRWATRRAGLGVGLRPAPTSTYLAARARACSTDRRAPLSARPPPVAPTPRPTLCLAHAPLAAWPAPRLLPGPHSTHCLARHPPCPHTARPSADGGTVRTTRRAPTRAETTHTSPPPHGGGRGARQMGHDTDCSSQRVRHGAWNRWPHGVTMRAARAPGSTGLKHTTHSGWAGGWGGGTPSPSTPPAVPASTSPPPLMPPAAPRPHRAGVLGVSSRW